MKYYLHDSSSFQDEKVTLLYMEFGFEAVGLFYVILEKLALQEKPILESVLKTQLKIGKRLQKQLDFMYEIGILSLTNGETFNENMANFSQNYQIKKEKTRKKVSEWRKNKGSAESVTSYVPVSNPPKVKGSKVKESKVNNTKEMVGDFIKQNPQCSEVVIHFLKTLDEKHRYRPKTPTQKMAWLSVAKWAINELEQCEPLGHGKEKVSDIITYFRSGDADNNGFSWVSNWQSLMKLKEYHRPGIYYLDYFWEQSKEKFTYGI